MKKFILFCMMVLAICISHRKITYACSCIEFNVDELIQNEDSTLFLGIVKKDVSSRYAVIEVIENYSQKPLNRYITVYSETTMSTACGINFNLYHNEELLIRGKFDDNQSKMKLSSCSITRVINGKLPNVILNDEIKDDLTVDELSDYIHNYYQSQTLEYGEITENSLNTIQTKTLISAYLPLGIGVIMFGGLITIVLILKSRKNKK